MKNLSNILTFIIILPSLAVLSSASAEEVKPNILWIVSEDNSAEWLGCYGNEYAQTPNLDRMADEGFRYANSFANAPVCAPQRFTWITGMHAISTGNHPMRCRYDIPPFIEENAYPRVLSANGYHTRNGNKVDTNGSIGNDAFDSAEKYSPAESWEDLNKTPWRDVRALSPDKPFFCVINLHRRTHESWNKGRRGNDPGEDSALRIAAYHPNTTKVRKGYDEYQQFINEMDEHVGIILGLLEEDGLSEDTIVVYTSDHGGVMYRSKRFLFHNGMHAPLIIRMPEKFRQLWPAESVGTPIQEVVSYIDLPATYVALAGGEVPENYQGRVFLGPNRNEPREYHFGYRERMDFLYDNARAVHDGRYLYIRNYAPYAPWVIHQPWRFKLGLPAMEWERLHQEGSLPPESERFWHPKEHDEEFYDIQADPDCVDNLIEDPVYATRIREMRAALREWQLEVNDVALLPENERARLIHEQDSTTYELMRQPDVYPLEALLDAADMATVRDPENLETLLEMTKDGHLGIRYWGTVGLLLLADKPDLSMDERLVDLMKDDGHEIRAYAAWALIERDSHTEEAYATLRELLQQRSYATLAVLNITHWLGSRGIPLHDAIVEFYALPQDDRRIGETGIPRDRLLIRFEDWFLDYLPGKLEGYKNQQSGATVSF